MFQIVREERVSGKVLKQNCMGGVEYLTFRPLRLLDLRNICSVLVWEGAARGFFPP